MMPHLYFTLVVFGLLLLAFHVPVARVLFQQRRRIVHRDRWILRWEASDYLSVGLAALALVPAALEVEHYYRARDLEAVSREIRHLIARWDLNPAIYAWSEGRKGQPVQDGVDLAENSLEMINHMVDEVEKYRQLALNGRYREAEASLRRTIKWIDLFSRPNPQYECLSDVDRKFISQIQGTMTRQREYSQRLADACAPLHDRSLKISLLLFSPYFLAASLAVRLAKVSAKLLLEYQKCLPADTPPTATVAPTDAIARAVSGPSQSGPEPKLEQTAGEPAPKPSQYAKGFDTQTSCTRGPG